MIIKHIKLIHIKLMDQFAKEAMGSMIKNAFQTASQTRPEWEEIPRLSYNMADNMLAERQRRIDMMKEE